MEEIKHCLDYHIKDKILKESFEKIYKGQKFIHWDEFKKGSKQYALLSEAFDMINYINTIEMNKAQYLLEKDSKILRARLSDLQSQHSEALKEVQKLKLINEKMAQRIQQYINFGGEWKLKDALNQYQNK